MGLNARSKGAVVEDGEARLKVAMRFQKMIASVTRLYKREK
jgi:hypothetical protein